ncbi:MAG: ABC transporter permease, partial [Bacteroidales bacterium]|nr:ABC transporter permease [Bacteroidales bacterium]
MKSIFRNMLSILRRYKMATILNVIGLSVAFAAFMVIMMQVKYERDFDRCHPTADRVFRVELKSPGTFSVVLPRAFIEAVLSSSAHIEAGTLINPYIGEVYFTLNKDDEKIGFKETVITCHPEIVETFGFPIIEGDANCLQMPDKVMIPESMARKMFGNKKAVGKTIHSEEFIWSKNDGDQELKDFTVGAVYRDFPGNTQLRNVIYMSIDENYSKTNFEQSNFICYVLLDDPNSAEDVAANFNKNFDFSNIEYEDEGIKLTPLTSIYFNTDNQSNSEFICGDPAITRLLIGIAILILIIACINYTNFSNAMTPVRMKSINTQKVFGASNFKIRFSLISEAVIISVFSWLMAILWVKIMSDSEALTFIDADIDISHNVLIIIITGIISIIAGIVADLYPSRYITSFPPAFVLKGNFGLSPKGRRFRAVLVGFQFVVSMALIIAASFMQLQNNYMQKYSLGFDKDHIAIVELNGDMFQNHGKAYADKLRTYPEVEDVAFSSQKIGAQDVYSTNSGNYKDQEFQYFMLAVSNNFFRTMGIDIVEGRDFEETYEIGKSFNCIFNSTAKKSINMEMDGFYYNDTQYADIIGFTEDIKITSMRRGENIVCFISNDKNTPVSYIRLRAGTNIREAVKHIQQTLEEIDSSYPFNIEFYDDLYNQMYIKETNMRVMVTVFSLLTVIISLAGVFGLVMFDSEYRRKEIGVRKV